MIEIMSRSTRKAEESEAVDTVETAAEGVNAGDHQEEATAAEPPNPQEETVALSEEEAETTPPAAAAVDEDSGVETGADSDFSQPSVEVDADDLDVASIVEAVLFSSDGPIKATRIAQVLGIGTARDVKKQIERLNERYEEVGSAFRILSIAGGFQMFTPPAYDPWLAKLQKAKADTRLTQAALETLAIVAYKQPIIRADIEAIRGVAAGEMLVRLRELKMVKIVGRAEEVGRPLLYGTTQRFLEVFGLSSLKELPKLDDEEGDDQAIPSLRLAQTEPADRSRAGNGDEPGNEAVRDEDVEGGQAQADAGEEGQDLAAQSLDADEIVTGQDTSDGSGDDADIVRENEDETAPDPSS